MEGCDWFTMQDLDRQTAQPKGSAFRAFKRLLPQLLEGRDFIVTNSSAPGKYLRELQVADRIYRNSIHPVLLSSGTAERIRYCLMQS